MGHYYPGTIILEANGNSTRQVSQLSVRTIGIDLRDHDTDLLLVNVLTERPHYGGQLSGGDGAGAILVKNVEGILEFSDLLVIKTELGF